MSLVISNASPLIGLCRIKRLHLLKDLWYEITIPLETPSSNLFQHIIQFSQHLWDIHCHGGNDCTVRQCL